MSTAGSYLLLIRLPRRTVVSRSSVEWNLRSGWYIYAGSAGNGLEGRLGRHLRVDSVRHWHIDHLLVAGRVADVQLSIDNADGTECRLAERVRNWPDAEPISGFGATDCGCPSHLVYFRRRPGIAIGNSFALEHMEETFAEFRSRYVDHTNRKRSPFRELICCILSLRTRDPVTHAADKRLFAKFHTPEDFASALPETIAELIYPVGMYNGKAETIIQIARELIKRFDGKTPSRIDELLTLPGVGRKTANLVRSFAFKLPAVCVDTHVHRISNRLGLVRTSAPEETERELRRVLPRKFWIELNSFLVQHGQQICKPTGAVCSKCPISSHCGYERLWRERRIVDAIPDTPQHPTLKFKGRK